MAERKIWEMTTDYRPNIDNYKKSENLNFIFPCQRDCLVSPACTLFCYQVFEYMNFIADHFVIMSDNEKNAYRKTTPNVLQRKITNFLQYNRRIAYPETAKVSRDWPEQIHTLTKFPV